MYIIVRVRVTPFRLFHASHAVFLMRFIYVQFRGIPVVDSKCVNSCINNVLGYTKLVVIVIVVSPRLFSFFFFFPFSNLPEKFQEDATGLETYRDVVSSFVNPT